MLFTDNQLNILNIFFSRPDLEIHMNEIGRILGKEPGVFQKGLNKLEEIGILSSRRLGSHRVFSLNKGCLIHDEIRSIVEKTSGLIPKLTEVFGEIDEVELAFVFGSFAKNMMRPDSDIDVMIICSQNIQEVVLKRLSAIETKMQREINPKFMTKKVFAAKRKEGDAFIEEVLNDKIVMLKGDI